MRIQVILNPFADNGRGAACAALIAAEARPFSGVDMVQTEHPGHATALARTAVHEGYDLVVAAGGDGTISDVVNGLVHGNKASTKLGILPIGSGNDLAWDLGVAMDLKTAVSRLFANHTQTIDLARIEDDRGRYRLADNNLGVGFDATVVIETERITRIHGFAKYLLATLRTIAFYYDAPHMTLTFDGETVVQDTLFITFGLGRRHGGGFLLTPDAKHDDNLIDSCTVDPINRLTMLRTIVAAIRGAHINRSFVTMRQNRQIIVRSDRPMSIHADGEVFAAPRDEVYEITVTSLPAALEVVV